MSKVTSKLQVTIPKAIAERYGIEPGDEIEFEPSGEVIRVIPPKVQRSFRLSLEERQRLFDEATERQQRRFEELGIPAHPPGTPRDWTREDLYTRGKDR